RPEYCEAVLEAAHAGCSLTAFAGIIGVSVDTIYEWRKCHSDFSEACSRAKPARVLWWERKLQRSRKDAETTAAMFALKNMSSDEWRDVKHTEHSHHMSADRLSTAQLHAIASGGIGGDGHTIDGEYSVVDEQNATR